MPTVFPNPTVYSITISGVSPSTKLAITDLSGKILLDWQYEYDEIIVESWPKGIYLIHFSEDYPVIRVLKN